MSLLEMLKEYGADFYELSGRLEMLLSGGRRAEKAGDSLEVDEEWKDWVRKLIAQCEGPATDMQLDSVTAQIARIQRILTASSCTHKEVSAAIEDLHQRMYDELSKQRFLHVASPLVPYYTTPLSGWGDVPDKFPSAIYDIEEASKCLALGRGTSCVFHLMRVMEAGLKAIAKPLGISYAPSWESYLKQINDKVAMKRPKKGIRWKRDEAYFIDVAGDLMAIKSAWRNPTMHVRGRYDTEQAEEILIAVRSFGQRLATKFHE